MRIPSGQEVREYLSAFFREYCWAVVCHCYLLLGGVVVGATVTLFPESYQGVRVSGWLISAFLIFLATFLAWLEERRKAKEASQKAAKEHQKVLSLEEQLKSTIRVSCGRRANKSVSTAEGMTFFRARLDLIGVEPVQNIEAALTAIRKDGEILPLDEEARFWIHLAGRRLEALREGIAEFVDVLKVERDGRVALAFIITYGSVDTYSCNEAGHIYQLDVSITGTTRTQKCTFEFEWTGDAATSDIRLVSSTPLSSIPDKAISQPLPTSVEYLGIETDCHDC